jgi:hypothetical protein
VQNVVQQPAAEFGKSPQETKKALDGQGLGQLSPAISAILENCQLPPTGFEPVLPD